MVRPKPLFPRTTLGKTQRINARPLSKTALAKLAAAARAVQRKIARNLREQAESVAKSQRRQLRAQKKEARLARESLLRHLAAERRRNRLAQRSAEAAALQQRKNLREFNRWLKDQLASNKRTGAKTPSAKTRKKTASTRRNGQCVHNIVRRPTARGRRLGAKQTYSDRNTARYQSLWLRKQKALALNAPLKKDNYYIFRPAANCRGASYRVTPLQEELKAIVKTLPSPVVIENGGAKSNWEFVSPVFKWAVKYPAAAGDEDGLFLPGPVPPNNIPPPAFPPGSGRTVYGYIYSQNWLIEQCVDSADRVPMICSSGTGVQRSGLLGSTSMLFYYRDEDAPFPPPAPADYIAKWPYNSVSSASFTFGSGRIGPFIYNDRQPFAPQPPNPVYYSNPASPFPGTLGDSNAIAGAGIVWESEVFPLTEQFDILLSFAYSVHSAGTSESYVEILQNGVPWKQLLLTDYAKGVHRAALPVTMLAGAMYQFRIVIDVASNIDAAIVRLGGTYVCNCPDYAKVEKKSTSRYTSQMRDRNWEPSAAGIKIYGDCKHIMRVKLLRGEGIEPVGTPDLDALRAWRKDRGTQDVADRKKQRKAQTQARRGIKADLEARRRQDRDERLAPARARRKAKRDAAKQRKARKANFERLNPGLVALKKKERDAKKARKRFVDRLNNRTPDHRKI